jgi:FkbM family methyltransferase
MLGSNKSPYSQLLPGTRIVRQLLLQWLGRKLELLNKYWIRPGDSLTATILLDSEYEQIEVETIKTFAREGFSDFFVDFGANIGIVSCETGDSFKEIHAFEPNPELLAILKSNLILNVREARFKVYPFALGSETKNGTLHLPRGNTGGAFIQGIEQAYSEATLAAKDGFTRYTADNYQKLPIEIRETETVLKELFESLSRKKLSKGVIKIDVEGFENHIIENLILTMPKGFHLQVVFESWDSVHSPEPGPWNNPMVKLFHLKQTHKFQSPSSRIMRSVLFLIFGWQKFHWEQVEVKEPGLGTNIIELRNLN